MMERVESRLDGTTLVVRSPNAVPAPRRAQAHRRPRRQRNRAQFKAQPDGTLVKALARAWRWQKLFDDGVYASVTEIGDAENISKSYVSRILRLALLGPDIVETILDGRCRRVGRSGGPRAVSGAHSPRAHRLAHYQA
jgi:hypothetical protein